MKPFDNLTILGIDTSCDDTCVAILEVRSSKFEVRSNIVSSQVKLHAKYGGVWPFLAKREHQKNLPIVFKKAIKEAKNSRIDLIVVTIGPGLEPCLWVGVNFAKDLAKKLNIPIIPVNHIEAHIFANFLEPQTSNFEHLFPAICLVVSGGHTQLILMNPVRGQWNLVKAKRKQTSNGVKDFGKYKILGETRDDAAGECLDKVARILGLGYPGGPAIAEYAQQWKSENHKPKSEIKLPRPMIYQKNYDFSFSGLKTAVLYLVRKLTSNKKQLTIWQKREICFEVQQAIIDVLIKKTIIATKNYKAKSIILGGGVAANKELKRQFEERIKKENLNSLFLIPDPQLCTDNGLMVAVAGYFNLEKQTKNWQIIKANANLRIDEN